MTFLLAFKIFSVMVVHSLIGLVCIAAKKSRWLDDFVGSGIYTFSFTLLIYIIMPVTNPTELIVTFLVFFFYELVYNMFAPETKHLLLFAIAEFGVLSGVVYYVGT